MTLDFTLGNIITLVVLGISAVGTYVTLRMTAADTAKKADVLERKVEDAQRKLEEHRFEVARDYVRRNDLREVKEELVASIQEIKATVRDAIAQALVLRNRAPACSWPPRDRHGHSASAGASDR